MKKKLLFTFALFLLFLISCAPINQEELKVQAAAQLENLTDEELQQVADGGNEMSAIAGQVYRINPTTNSALRRLSTSVRNALVTAEQARRQPRQQDEPCAVDSECMSGLRCRYDSVTRRNTCQGPPWPLGSPCERGIPSQCREGLACILNSAAGQFTCQAPPWPMTTPCTNNAQCETGLCGLDQDRRMNCESPNTAGDLCVTSAECSPNLFCNFNANLGEQVGRCEYEPIVG